MFCSAFCLCLLLCLQQHCKVEGQLDLYLDLNLEEEVPPTTEAPSCDELIKRRSLNEHNLNKTLPKSNVTEKANLTETNRTTESSVTHITSANTRTEKPVIDDCLVYISKCPEEIKISWLQALPFVYAGDVSSEIARNKSEKDAQLMKGIFHEIVTRAIGICCKRNSRVIPKIRYLKRASDLRALQRDISYGSADMIIPVHTDEMKYGGSLPYVKILDSPGVVLIRRHFQSPITEWKLLFDAILGTWPVVLVAFLMSSVAGVFMWALDSSHNSKQFPRPFGSGALEGFWWAFVTITTVGYGDKAPKSSLARSFAVVWIIVGVTVCSVMTATLSNALTNVKIEKFDVTTGKRIGVLKDSPALEDAVNMAANITTLEDPDEMFEALKSGDGIDGILEELFTGIESMKRKDPSKQLSVAKFIWHSRAFGVAYRNDLFEKYISDCLSNVIKFRYNDVLRITSNYIRATEAVESKELSSDEGNSPMDVFNSQSPIFLAFIIALSLFLLVVLVGGKVSFLVTKYKRYQASKLAETNGSESNAAGEQECSSVCGNGQEETQVKWLGVKLKTANMV